MSWCWRVAAPYACGMNQSRIPQLRRQLGWTQERLATESTVAVRTIQRLESGKDANLDSLALIAKALGVPVSELFVQVEMPAFSESVRGLQDRQDEEARQTQQARRDAITDTWRRVYGGLGVVVAIAVIALIALHVLPGLGIFIVGAYWVGGKVAYEALVRLVLDPRLDERFPLSVPSATSRRRGAVG